MERKIINELPDYPHSKNYQPIKATLASLIDKVTALEKDKNKETYLNTFKQIGWAIGKCSGNWPAEVEEIVSRLKSDLSSFQSLFINQSSQKSKGFFLCGGGSSKPKEELIEPIFKRILSYQHVFTMINIYQDKKLKEDLVYNVLDLLQKNHSFDRSTSKVMQKSIKQDSIKPEIRVNNDDFNRNSDYCELLKAISVCPNGFVAKKLLKELNDVEWIAGILYEEGKVVDKNLNKAIEFYETGRRKKNPQAIYRLGLLNQKGQYGKPLQYLKMWEEAAKMGHLQSMTDLGYLYENGLEEEQRLILQPNPQKAFQYYSKAVEKNFPRALNNLASFYFNNPKYKSESKCMDFFQRAAQAEYVKSLYNLGIIYMQGQIGVQDEQKAKRLIKRSAEKGDLQGKQQYVEMMLSDVHKCTADDLDQINMYCRQIIAEEEDNPYPYYFLGVMYEGGYGVSQEPKTALLYYTKATRYNCPEAYIKLGQCFKNGFGVQQSSKDAIRQYQKAVDSLPQANIYIGQLYQNGAQDLKPNYQQAFNHYYNACNHQIPEAFTHLGNMYKNGKHVKRDDAKAEEYFARGRNSVRKITNKLSSSSELIQSSYFRGRK